MERELYCDLNHILVSKAFPTNVSQKLYSLRHTQIMSLFMSQNAILSKSKEYSTSGSYEVHL
jgi:hypothetical protein